MESEDLFARRCPRPVSWLFSKGDGHIRSGSQHGLTVSGWTKQGVYIFLLWEIKVFFFWDIPQCYLLNETWEIFLHAGSKPSFSLLLFSQSKDCCISTYAGTSGFFSSCLSHHCQQSWTRSQSRLGFIIIIILFFVLLQCFIIVMKIRISAMRHGFYSFFIHTWEFNKALHERG